MYNCRDIAGSASYIPSPQRPPVIRLRSRRRRRALDHIQPVHLAVGIAALGEVADVADISRKTRIQEVGVERDDYIGLFKIVARLDRLAEGQLRAFEHVVAIHRLVHVPLGLRIHLKQAAKLIGERGRRNGRRENADARALQCLLRAERAANRGEKRLPRALVAHRSHALRAVRIV
jgi:hypothetical protein